jgi:hypothetical protein
MVDPVTGTHMQDNQVIMVRQPDNGYASIVPAYAGLYVSGGINEKGIGIGILYSWSDDQTLHGTPIRFRIPMILDQAGNPDEAISIIISNKTTGTNMIISGIDPTKGYVAETTYNITYVGTWDSIVESTGPCWEIDHVVRRTNFFVNPATAATQRKHYNPSSLFLMLLGKNDYFPMWRHYRSLSKGIETYWGNLDLNNSMSIFRDTYIGKTDIFLWLVNRVEFIKNIAERYGFLQAVNQWAAYPETGDILVSFASADKNAFENPIHHFNLFELIDN